MRLFWMYMGILEFDVRPEAAPWLKLIASRTPPLLGKTPQGKHLGPPRSRARPRPSSPKQPGQVRDGLSHPLNPPTTSVGLAGHKQLELEIEMEERVLKAHTSRTIGRSKEPLDGIPIYMLMLAKLSKQNRESQSSPVRDLVWKRVHQAAKKINYLLANSLPLHQYSIGALAVQLATLVLERFRGMAGVVVQGFTPLHAAFAYMFVAQASCRSFAAWSPGLFAAWPPGLFAAWPPGLLIAETPTQETDGPTLNLLTESALETSIQCLERPAALNFGEDCPGMKPATALHASHPGLFIRLVCVHLLPLLLHRLPLGLEEHGSTRYPSPHRARLVAAH